MARLLWEYCFNLCNMIYIFKMSKVYIVFRYIICRGEKMPKLIKFKDDRINFWINGVYKKQVVDYAKKKKGMNLTDYIMYCIQKDMK